MNLSLKERVILFLNGDSKKISKTVFITITNSKQNETNYYNKSNFDNDCRIIASFRNDNIKIKAIKQLVYIRKKLDYSFDEDLFLLILSAIKSNEKKIELLRDNRLYFNSNEKACITTSIKDDNFKIKLLKDDSLNFSNYDKTVIICSFKDDSFKIRLLIDNSLDLNSNEKTNIIISLKSDDLKKELLKDNTIGLSSLNKGAIICSLVTEKTKIELLKDKSICLANYNKIQIICHFETEELKIKLLKDNDLGLSFNEKADIILSLKTDKEKLFAIKETGITDKQFLSKIIINFNDETCILSVLEQFDLDNYSIVHMIKKISDSKVILNNLKKVIKNEGEYYAYEYLQHLDLKKENYIYEQIFDDIKPYLVSRFNLNEDNLVFMTQTFGYNFYKYLNENLISIINGPKENIKILHELIFSKNMTMNDINMLYNSFLHYKFALYNPDIMSVFVNLRTAIEEKNKDFIKNTIINISKFNIFDSLLLNNDFCELMIQCNYDLKMNNFVEFLNVLCEDIMVEQNYEKKYILNNLLHYVTDYYIRIEKELYINKELFNAHINLQLSSKPNKDKILKYMYNSFTISEIKAYLLKLDLNNCNNKEVQNFLSLPNINDIIDCCIMFKKEPSNYNDTFITREELLKKYLKPFSNLLDECYKTGIFNDIDCDTSILDYYIENKKENYYTLLQEINYDRMCKYIFGNSIIIEKMKYIIKKYKIFKWDDIFSNIFLDLKVEMNNGVKASMLTYGDKLVEKFSSSDSRLNPTTILNFMQQYGSSSEIFRLLFGQENYNFLVNNPSPNSASADKNTRLMNSVKMYKKMYERTSITVPPICSEFKIDDNKAIKVTIGDITNPDNLTYGERTGACMRIGGVGETLFTFCLLDKNGFHIRFDNPKTGGFISRVSGFRNGNTVFLNELRNSYDNDYSDNDLIVCLKQIAERLIEMSKNSKCPIENIVISDGYVMHNSSKTIDLGVNDIKEGLTNFYSDVCKYAIVCSNNGILVPVKLSIPVPTYKTIRMKPQIVFDSKQACDLITHIKIIESILVDKDVKNVEYITNVNMAIVGEDWYIYIDNQGVLCNKIIEGINKKRASLATKEMKIYLEKILSLVNVGIEEKKNMRVLKKVLI